MSFRSGQSGTVIRKGQMWRGRYYVDLPGREERRRVSVPLGSVLTMKKPEAKRKLRALLQEMGLNDDTHLERTDSTAKMFRAEAEWWKENRLTMCKPSVQRNMGSHLEKYLMPRFGSLPVSAIDERRVQEFISELTRTQYVVSKGRKKLLSPKSIRNIVGVLKLIVGRKVWRDWTLRYPEIPIKEQRFFSPDEMRRIIEAAPGQWRVLFATLAGTGMRCGEAFGLHVDDLDLTNGRIYIRRSVWEGEEVSVKTKQGYRAVTIDPVLSGMLAAHLDGRRAGRVFQTRNGTPLCKRNSRRRLNELLRDLKLPKAGLHAFRHGRVSVLQAMGVPGDLVKEWVGHSNLQMTSRYTHFQDDFRRQIASQVALYSLPICTEKLKDGPLGPPFVENSATA
jgi:integrase